MSFEHHKKPLLPRNKYYIRVLRFAGFGALLIGLSLGIGMIGYHFFSDLPWLDSLLNAAMILTGMGPVDPMLSNEAKWFASIYAIYSGVAFLSIVAVFLAPIVHRFLHRIHLDENQAKK